MVCTIEYIIEYSQPAEAPQCLQFIAKSVYMSAFYAPLAVVKILSNLCHPSPQAFKLALPFCYVIHALCKFCLNKFSCIFNILLSETERYSDVQRQHAQSAKWILLKVSTGIYISFNMF